jgi:hypothetical protein
MEHDTSFGPMLVVDAKMPATCLLYEARELRLARDKFHHRIFSHQAERRGARDIGSDFDRRRQSRRCYGESEVTLRHARHAPKTGRVAYLGSGEGRIVRLENRMTMMLICNRQKGAS